MLRTPSVTDSTGGAISETQARERGRMVKVADQVAELAFDNGLPVSPAIESSLFGTPRTSSANASTRKQVDAGAPKARLEDQVELLPTPAVAHLRNHDEPVENYLERRQDFIDGKTKGMPGASLGVAVRMDWGKFEPAIRRWESVLQRPAPAPTKPDGKDGAHRLSAEFTEWMMGVPEGWITGVEIGLKRNEQLKACGNGVVPQQAVLALRMLLQDVDLWR